MGTNALLYLDMSIMIQIIGRIYIHIQIYMYIDICRTLPPTRIHIPSLQVNMKHRTTYILGHKASLNKYK